MLLHAAPSGAFALFEDNLHDSGHACLLQDCHACLSVTDPAALPAAFAALDEARQQGQWAALATHYELGLALEPALASRCPPGTPLLRAWIFNQASELTGDALEAWWASRLDELTPAQREAGLLQLTPDWTQTTHAQALARILAWIHAGDCYQVNLTFPLHGRHYGHALALAAQLRMSQPVAHGALIHDGADWIISRSPELFMARQGERLLTRPMKGTAARLPDPQADAAAAAALLASPKDQAENLMIVDLIRNDLGRLTPPGGVRVTRLFELERYPSVYQLTSSIEAAPVRAGLADILRALFPCGSVTGAPKIRAMQIIDELETTPRGLYCGGLGWLAPSGDFSLNVPIRTLQVTAAGDCQLNVGSGIVADSEAAAEYRECLSKAAFALRAPLQLIETLRREADGSYPRLPGHLARLQRSASELGFACPPDSALCAALQAQPAPGGPSRVRLLLSRDGRIDISCAALDPLPARLQLGLAPFALDAHDPRLRHKTTARRFYDEALQAAMQRGLFDLVFCNQAGEVCEGARSNLFIETDGGLLLTPPSSCGLLPGVLRAELLASAQAREAVLTLTDLRQARRVFAGNALRGLLEVELIPAP